ncbi:MAG: hypothetical protein IJS53_04425, partial [Clostridia bacterium]|nr:hypothetical protein [Clostridia bacterium]
TVQAQNALLKSLEEPDGETRFLLTASGDTGLLSTVRSRCRVVRMPAWGRESVQRELLRRGAKPDQAAEIAALCGGSVGLALSMLDDPAFYQLRALCEKTFFSLRAPRDVPLAAAQLRDKKDDADELLGVVEQRVREYLLFALNAGAQPAAAADTACHESWLHAAPERLERALAAVIDAQRYRAANVSWQAVCEKLLYIISEEISPWQPS